MSRDRLAERRRAQQESQRSNGSSANPLQSSSYDYDDYGYGYDAGPPPGRSAYGARNGASSRQASESAMNYSNEYAQASNPSLHGAPPPSYRSRHEDDYDAAPDSSRQQPRDNRRRRPSNGNNRSDSQSRQRSRSHSQDQQPPPMPTSTRRGQDPSYGMREDQNTYYESNQSSLALNTRPQPSRQQSYGNFDQETPKRSRKGSSAVQQNEMYEIPTLSKGARQRQQSYMEPQSPPYSSVAPGSAGPSSGAAGAGGAQVTSNAPDIDMNAFFEELDSVRDQMKEMERFIGYLDQLHSRNLSGTNNEEAAAELQHASGEMRQMTNNLRVRIKDLQETTRIRTHGQAEQDRLVRKTQIEGLRNKFMEVLQAYQSMEMKHRDKSKQRIERQFMIANPDANPEEVRRAVESGEEVQVFAQALRQSNRVGNAQRALNEVQSRHEDIKQIEKTLVELFQLFQDMAHLVEEQDEQIIMIEQKAEEVAKDVEAGHTEIVQAVVSAKKARKKRKCCCIISLILLLIIGGVVAYLVVKVILPKINENKDNDDDKEKETKTVTQSAGTRTQQAAVNTNANTNTNVINNVSVTRATTTPVAGATTTAVTARALEGRSVTALSMDPEEDVVGYLVKF